MNVELMLNDEIKIIQNTPEYQEYVRIQTALNTGNKYNELIQVKMRQLEKLQVRAKAPVQPKGVAKTVNYAEENIEAVPEEKIVTPEEKVSKVTNIEADEVGQEEIDIELPDLDDLEDD
jgi:hypothetical protein